MHVLCYICWMFLLFCSLRPAVLYNVFIVSPLPQTLVKALVKNLAKHVFPIVVPHAYLLKTFQNITNIPLNTAQDTPQTHPKTFPQTQQISL